MVLYTQCFSVHDDFSQTKKFLEAVKNGDIDNVNLLLQDGISSIDINVCDEVCEVNEPALCQTTENLRAR